MLRYIPIVPRHFEINLLDLRYPGNILVRGTVVVFCPTNLGVVHIQSYVRRMHYLQLAIFHIFRS